MTIASHRRSLAQLTASPTLLDSEFRSICQWIHKTAGINLGGTKRALVESRLAKRLRDLNLSTYGEYFDLINHPGESSEKQFAIDLLTTNETYFFREEKHFQFIRDTFLPRVRNRTVNFWSAACSSGEEVWSLAITLKDHHLGDFSGLGTDINIDVLTKARRGVYVFNTTKNLTQATLRKHFLQGVNDNAGTIKITKTLQQKCTFKQTNLLTVAMPKKSYDLIFLRNVMIYFDSPTKQKVIDNVMPSLKDGGYFFLSHSETLNGLSHGLKVISPSIYQRVT